MIAFLILIAVVISISILLNNASSKMGIPVLLAFILLGMVFSYNGLFPIKIEDYSFVEQICTAALVFIMFYGGFGTRWSSAKPVASEAILLANLGVILTAAFTGVFCHYVLKWGWIESFLLGSVVSSTDAASVFSILRSRKLGLKNGIAPLIEVESGSNDPCSYMLTIVMLSILKGSASVGNIVWMMIAQLGFGVIFGFLIGKLAIFAMRKINFVTSGFDSMFLIAVALFAYAIPSLIGGNGFLSVYIVGVILGNGDFGGKRNMVHFFDGFTSLMQVMIFFMLGLLAYPENLIKCIGPALLIFLALLFIARPLTVALLLTPYGKYGIRQQSLISFCGLRGASSIVFAIMATIDKSLLTNDIFNIVFCIVLLSIGIQGSLLPAVAKRIGLIDSTGNVMKNFSDFSEEVDLQFSEIKVNEDSIWKGKRVMDLGIPHDMRLCLIIKADGERIVPVGGTVIEEGDSIIVCSKCCTSTHRMRIIQHTISPDSKWDGKLVREYPVKKSQIILIQRNGSSIIPNGSTELRSNDTLYITTAY